MGTDFYNLVDRFLAYLTSSSEVTDKDLKPAAAAVLDALCGPDPRYFCDRLEWVVEMYTTATQEVAPWTVFKAICERMNHHSPIRYREERDAAQSC